MRFRKRAGIECERDGWRAADAESSLHAQGIAQQAGPVPDRGLRRHGACAGGAPIGLTINSFVPVSLEPPLVSWNLSERSASVDVFRACRHFGISVLPRSQEAVARRFADPGIADKFNGVATRRAFAGIRLIEGAVATFVYEAYRAWPVGDHLLLVGKVLQIDGGDDEPLVFHQGRFLSMRLTQMA